MILRRDLTFTLTDHTDVISDVIEGADIPCADLMYSLNKNRRWLLPDLIKEIQTDSDFGTVDFELVERHKLMKNNNCFEIFTSYIISNDDDLIRSARSITPTHIYLDADNVLKTQSIYSRKYNRLRFLNFYTSTYPEESEIEIETNVPEDDREPDTTMKKNDCSEEQKDVKDEDEIPKVRYEVLYPCVYTNVITQKPKQIGNKIGKTFKCRNYIRKPWTVRKYQFRSRLAKEKRMDMEDEIEEGLEDYIFARDTVQKYTKLERPNKDGRTLLHERETVISKTTEQVKTKESSKRRLKNVDLATENVDHKDNNSKKEEESPVVLLTPEDETNVSRYEARSLDGDGGAETVIFPRNISVLPVCVLLRQEEINVDTLNHEYGEDVLECKSSPRRFIINISKYVQDLDLEGIGSAYKLLRIMNKTMLSWLIFVHDPANKCNSVTEKAFRVSLNANFNENITRVKIEGLVEGTTVSISTVIENTINYLKHLPRESMVFEMKPNINKYRPIVKSRSILEEMKRWSCWTYIPDDFYVLKHLLESEFSSSATSKEKQQTIQDSQEQTKAPTCSICYRYTNMKIALHFCFHSFCNACWEAYIHEKFEIGSTLIHCPEKDCFTPVDIGTIMSFLSVKEILTFARRCHNMTVEKNKLAKWCTNETCERVIIVNTIRSKSLRCCCGELICFACSGIPHWPLPCRKYLDYVQMLLETRDKNISPHEFVIKFDVKYCRICFKAVKRYDRCMTTDCPCGSVLCFRCSTLWHSKNISSDKLRENTTASLKSNESYTGLASEKKTFSANKRTTWYKLAMKHRLNQHPYRLAKLQASSKLLANRISHYILREERKGNYVNLDFAVDDTSYLRESERAAHYMTCIVEMYTETSSIIENTSFSLNDESYGDQEAKELLHRRAMILSTCAKTILDIIKDGAFLNPKVVIERLNGTSREIRRVIGYIVKDL